MAKRLTQSLQEAVKYAKDSKTQGNETKIKVFESVKIPDTTDVQSLRNCLNMTQAEFSARFGFNLNTLRNWERGRRHPDKAVLTYLCVISKIPELVENSLQGK